MLATLPTTGEGRSILPPDLATDAAASASLPDPSGIDPVMFGAYFKMHFQHVELSYAAMFRRIGEKDTPQEGKLHFNVSMPLDAGDARQAGAAAEVERWSNQKGAGTFMVPATMHPAVLTDNKGTEDRVAQFATLCLDLDKGHPAEAVKHLTLHFAPFTMLVASGGITAEGHEKLHVYWALSEPTDQIAKVARMRELIALKVGGDPSFKRATQVIRVPGTVYGKGGVSRLCQILEYDERREIHL